MDDGHIEAQRKEESYLWRKKIQNLLAQIYYDEARAWENWQEISQKHRFDVFLNMVQHEPNLLGKVRGNSRFVFFRSKSFHVRQRALLELKFTSKKWQATLIRKV